MSLRLAMKSMFAGAVSTARLDRIARRDPLVVFYHRVVERMDSINELSLPAMAISSRMLEHHLDWLSRNFRIVPPEALIYQPSSSKPLAAVTFDDGYSDVYHHAFPVLRRKGIPAGVFVVTELVGTNSPPVHEILHALLVRASRSRKVTATDLLRDLDVRPSLLKEASRVEADAFAITRFLLRNLPQDAIRRLIDRLRSSIDVQMPVELQPLTWEMLEEMRDAGMSIGSHSKTHPFLPNESKARVLEEVAGSRRLLQQKLGVDATCFAYPAGGFDREVVDAVAAAGYRVAFTICDHGDERFPTLTMSRTGLWQQSCVDHNGRFSPAVMSCQAAGMFRWMSPCRETHSVAHDAATAAVALTAADSV